MAKFIDIKEKLKSVPILRIRRRGDKQRNDRRAREQLYIL